jgi:hypothetical protein
MRNSTPLVHVFTSLSMGLHIMNFGGGGGGIKIKFYNYILPNLNKFSFGKYAIMKFVKFISVISKSLEDPRDKE